MTQKTKRVAQSARSTKAKAKAKPKAKAKSKAKPRASSNSKLKPTRKATAKRANKTLATDASVAEFVAAITPDAKRLDAELLLAMMKRVTGLKPKMWGSSIIGFGSYHYKYDSGREGDFFRTGFAPRKTNFAIYIMPGFDAFAPLLRKLGKYKTGRSCLYVKRLQDVDAGVLEELIDAAFQQMKAKYPD